MKYSLTTTLLSLMLAASCTNQSGGKTADEPSAPKAGTFGYDLGFLKQHDSVIVLQSDGGRSRVIVSPKYQGKVFTSTADGEDGLSFGWIHYKAFTAAVDSHMNAYGGENRLWLGPEGGKFSLFFPKGAKMEFANWKTPSAFDTEAWKVIAQDSSSVNLQKDMQLVNYTGTPLSISIGRQIAILPSRSVMELLHLAADSSLKVVGYQTINTLTNSGKDAWTETGGMPCIWILDMFNPTPATTIIVPYKEEAPGARQSRIATTNYFGEIPDDRIRFDHGTLLFKADGKSRGKLGINPVRAKNMAGSYDAQNKVLTLTLFDVDSTGRYLNQEWNTAKPPFSGDAVNAYNDGPLADGSQMGPFYEIESVSPAAALQPGQTQTHRHAVFHFTGSEAALDRICQQLLNVSLKNVQNAFPAAAAK